MAVSGTVRELRRLGETQLRQALNDRVARAFLCEGGAREVALDANARLFTELRLRRIWPPSSRDPRCVELQDDGA